MIIDFYFSNGLPLGIGLAYLVKFTVHVPVNPAGAFDNTFEVKVGHHNNLAGKYVVTGGNQGCRIKSTGFIPLECRPR